nr:zinc finger, CCHC-type [Tanacetum cinerariifolium]
MHFFLSSMGVVYLLTTSILEDGENATMERIRKRNKWENDDYVCRGLILNGMSDPLFDFYQNVESSKELWDSLEAKYMAEDASSLHITVGTWMRPFRSHLRIEESLRVQDSDKPKGNNVVGPSVVNMVKHNNSIKYNDNKDDDVAWWVDSEATVHLYKDRCWFKTYESLNDGSILHMENESTALVYGRGCVDLRFGFGKIVSLFNVLHVPNIRKNLVSSSILNNYGYKYVIESNKFVIFKHYVFISFGYLSNQMFRINIVNDNIDSAFMSTSKLNESILWHARLGHVHFKRMQDISKDGLILAFDMDTKKFQVDLTKEFLSSRFFMKDMREADVILGIRIKLEMITPMDIIEKLMPNNGKGVSQLEYSRVIGCLMYAMTCTRLAIAFVVGKLRMYTSNPSTHHWQAIQRSGLVFGTNSLLEPWRDTYENVDYDYDP